jgi:anaerobic ribonucleoside-triphosphate reductase
MKVFDFQCKQGHIHEAFVRTAEDQICPDCGEASSKIISATKTVLDPISGSFPGATMKWARDREQKIKHERKVANS